MSAKISFRGLPGIAVFYLISGGFQVPLETAVPPVYRGLGTSFVHRSRVEECERGRAIDGWRDSPSAPPTAWALSVRRCLEGVGEDMPCDLPADGDAILDCAAVVDAAPDAGVADLVLEVLDGGVGAVAEAGQAGDGEVDGRGPQEPGDDACASRRDAGVRARGIPGDLAWRAGNPVCARRAQTARPTGAMMSV